MLLVVLQVDGGARPWAVAWATIVAWTGAGGGKKPIILWVFPHFFCNSLVRVDLHSDAVIVLVDVRDVVVDVVVGVVDVLHAARISAEVPVHHS